MKKLNDDEIQKLLEEGLAKPDEEISATEQEDIKAYQFLFENLRKEPEEGLPYNFAAKVRLRVQEKINRTSDIKLYLYAAVIGIAGFGIAYMLLVFYNQQAASKFYSAISGFKWVFVLALISFLAIQYLDQKLVKENKR